MQSPFSIQPRRLAAAMGLATLLMLAACGDDDDDDTAASTAAESSDETTADTTEAPEVSNSCETVPEPEGGAINQTAVVNMIDFEICQPDITIQAGEAIEFVNNGAARHQVAHQPEGEGARFFRSDPLLTGDTFVKTIETPGVYNYICSYHFEEMTAVITVEE